MSGLMRERSILAILVMLVASLGYVAVRYDRSTHPAFRQKLDDLLFYAFLAVAGLLLGYHSLIDGVHVFRNYLGL